MSSDIPSIVLFSYCRTKYTYTLYKCYEETIDIIELFFTSSLLINL